MESYEENLLRDTQDMRENMIICNDLMNNVKELTETLESNKKILLQKWNNMILNYNGGILDIFLFQYCHCLLKGILSEIPTRIG